MKIRTLWKQWFIGIYLIVIVLAMGLDYGKHWVLKRVLEQEIEKSKEVVSLASLSVSVWPLLHNHLVLKDCHVNGEGIPIPIHIQEIHLRQGWKDWRLAHIKAVKTEVAESSSIQKIQGILDTKDLTKQIKVTELVLTDIKAKLPLVAFFGSQASFDFIYRIAEGVLTLKGHAPELAFANGVTFGLSGEGYIHTQPDINGKIDLKIKNIDKMMNELVSAHVIEATQGDLVLAGSRFLGKIGLHDLSLPLHIHNGDVTLGPILLFKVGK